MAEIDRRQVEKVIDAIDDLAGEVRRIADMLDQATHVESAPGLRLKRELRVRPLTVTVYKG